MQELFPALVFRRTPKADFMRLDRLPADQQKVFVLALHAPLQLVRDVAGHRSDDRLRFPERGFEVGSQALSNLELGQFENHSAHATF